MNEEKHPSNSQSIQGPMHPNRHIDIGSIGPTGVDKSPSPNAKEREERAEEDLNRQFLKLKNQSLEQKIHTTKSTRWLRYIYAILIFAYMLIWTIVVLVIIFFSGFNSWGFKLSDNVLMTLIGGTTANVIGLVLVIAKGLFPSNKD